GVVMCVECSLCSRAASHAHVIGNVELVSWYMLLVVLLRIPIAQNTPEVKEDNSGVTNYQTYSPTGLRTRDVNTRTTPPTNPMLHCFRHSLTMSMRMQVVKILRFKEAIKPCLFVVRSRHCPLYRHTGIWTRIPSTFGGLVRCISVLDPSFR